MEQTKKFFARILFCMVPALMFGSIVSIAHFGAGVIVFVAVFWFGLSITERRPERGER